MDKMKEGLQKRARRMQENLQQSVGLSEKRDELQRVSHIEQRNQKMIAAIKNARQNLQNCIRSGNKDDPMDKRKKRLEEFTLWQQLQIDSKEFENLFLRTESPVFSDVLKLYSDAVGVILEDRVITDQFIEKTVIGGLTRYLEEDKALSKAKEKLARTLVDVEVSRKRYHGTHDDLKAQEIKDEYDNIQLKLENYKDNVYTDVYTLASKEAEIASIFKNLIDAQMEFHRTALLRLENAFPEVERKIACYSKRPVFGCHLEDHLRYTNRRIAVVLEVCCTALFNCGLKEKGLFRINGNNNRIRRMKAAFDAHQMTGNSSEPEVYATDPHSVCSVLKSYLRELPEPLMTHALHSEWVMAAKLDPDARREAICRLLPQLPEANRINLAYLMRFLQLMLRYEQYTMMNAANLAIVFGPNLIDGGSGSESENVLGSKLVETLLVYADAFFPNDRFEFTVPILSDAHNNRVLESSSSFDGERSVSRSTQLQIDVVPTASNDAYGSSSPVHNSSPQMSTLSRRPRMAAPPPPTYVSNSPNECGSSQVDDISSGLEQLNCEVTKSPSIASNDSMAEYGYSNVKIPDDFMNNPMSRSFSEARPSRPPPPRVIAPPQAGDNLRPTSCLNLSSPIEFPVDQPSRKNTLNTIPNMDRSYRHMIHLEVDAHQTSGSPSPPNNNGQPKPPIPNKPRPAKDGKIGEVTKL